jgi:hypothetical protein
MCCLRYTQQLLLDRRQRDITTAWQRRKRHFLEEAERQLREAHSAAAASLAAAPARVAHEVAGVRLAAQVSSLRALKQQQQQVRQWQGWVGNTATDILYQDLNKTSCHGSPASTVCGLCCWHAHAGPV